MMKTFYTVNQAKSLVEDAGGQVPCNGIYQAAKALKVGYMKRRPNYGLVFSPKDIETLTAYFKA